MEWISGVAIVTAADGRVIGAPTAGIVATSSGAGIATPLIYTGPIRGAFGTGSALGLAVGRRAHVVWQAGAHGSLPSYVTSAEQPTRRGSARVFGQGQVHVYGWGSRGFRYGI